MKLPVILLALISSTLSTMSPAIFVISSIFFCVWVSINAFIFSRIMGSRTYASQNVFLLRDLLQMIRINAQPISAQMIYLITFFNWSILMFIRKSMGINILARNIYFAISAASSHYRSSPKPASFFYFFPKSFFYGFSPSRHSRSYTSIPIRSQECH